MYIQVAFGSSVTCDWVWRLGRGLSGETLESPDKTGNNMSLPVETLVSPDKTGIDMSLSGEGGDLPDKAILKRKTQGGREVACLRHVRNSVILQIAFRVMCHRTV